MNTDCHGPQGKNPDDYSLNVLFVLPLSGVVFFTYTIIYILNILVPRS